MSALRRIRGLVQLVGGAVEHGSLAIERVQKETAARPFGILEQIPPTAALARVVHEIHDLCVSSTHAVIRGVAHVSVRAIDVSLEAIDREQPAEPTEPTP